MQNIQNEINLVKEKILSFCCESQNLQDVLKEFLSRKSKLIRSIVAILFLKSANEIITDEQYSILAATELIHNASLIHDDAIDENVSSNSFNVVLAATLFHPMTERMTALKVGQKYSSIIKENLFKKVLVIAIQKGTFEAVYDFLESEANDEV